MLADQPERPEELGYVFDWYMEIRGDELITYSEIKSWAELTHQQPLAWEVDLIRTLDRVYWRTLNG